MDTLRERFWQLPLDALSRPEWEALCDGCGQCCLHKLEDDDTGEILHTNVACRLLDIASARCQDYRHRKAYVPDCLRLTPQNVHKATWLPASCAYRLRAEGQDLLEWHPLLSGDPASVRRAGISIAGRVVSEDEAGPLEHHIIDLPTSEAP